MYQTPYAQLQLRLVPSALQAPADGIQSSTRAVVRASSRPARAGGVDEALPNAIRIF